MFQIREIYAKCSMEHITSTQPFKDCMQLIGFQSQLKLVDNIKNALKEINSLIKIDSTKPLRSTPTKNNINVAANDLGINFSKTIRVHMMTFLRQIENANSESTVFSSEADTEINMETENVPASRYKLKEVNKILMKLFVIIEPIASYI